MSSLKIGVIIVTYHTPLALVRKVQSEIQKQLKAQIFIIDNSNNNKGFAHAVNKGIQQARLNKCTLFIICNPDIHSLKCSKLDISEAALKFDIFGGMMYQKNVTYYGGIIDYWTMAGGLSQTKPDTRLNPCDFVSGAFMCISDNTVKTVGLFPEEYFMYYEDVAYCYTAKQRKLRVGISTALSYKHDELSKNFIEKSYYLSRNRLIFLFKYGTFLQRLRELLRMPIKILTLYMHKTSTNSLQLQGYIDFLYGKKIPY